MKAQIIAAIFVALGIMTLWLLGAMLVAGGVEKGDGLSAAIGVLFMIWANNWQRST